MVSLDYKNVAFVSSDAVYGVKAQRAFLRAVLGDRGSLWFAHARRSLTARDEGTPVGKSFYLGTDAELQTGSQSFSTKISATPTAYGLTAAQATAYAALDATWQAAYTAAKDPETRTKAKVQAKNDAKAAIKVMTADRGARIDQHRGTDEVAGGLIGRGKSPGRGA